MDQPAHKRAVRRGTQATRTRRERDFVSERNVVVFEHLALTNTQLAPVAQHLCNPFDLGLAQRAKSEVTTYIERACGRFLDVEIASHIKAVYLFITEGYYAALQGAVMGQEQEQFIRGVFADFCSTAPQGPAQPQFVLVGVSELRALLAPVEAALGRGTPLASLLTRGGEGGYDTPKLAAAIIHLARKDFWREEVFMRMDDDVGFRKGADLENLKAAYFREATAAAPEDFAISGVYVHGPRGATTLSPDELRNEFLNTYSVRTHFLTRGNHRARLNAADLSIDLLDRDDALATLDLMNARYFIDLMRMGRWGSGLTDPISGAGMIQSPESLEANPPFLNAPSLVMWIDDFILSEIKRAYARTRQRAFRSEQVPDAGFTQERRSRPNDGEVRVSDVKWAVSASPPQQCYLDRLLMGMVMAFCVHPRRYTRSRGSPLPRTGFCTVLECADLASATAAWKALREPLRSAAMDHLRQILHDWRNHLCDFGSRAGQPPTGRIPTPPARPDGTSRYTQDTPFGAYVLRQLILIERGDARIADGVLAVLEEYLKLKYTAWPVLVRTVAARRQDFIRRSYDTAGTLMVSPQTAAGPAATGAPTATDGAAAPQTSGCVSAPPSAPTAGAVPLHREDAATGWLWVQAPSKLPLRQSAAACALITKAQDTGAAECWLLQWNPKWGAMNFIGGHIENGETALACCLREIHEELFTDLAPEDLDSMRRQLAGATEYAPPLTGAKKTWNDPSVASAVPHGCHPLEYVEFSDSARSWTYYCIYAFDVKLSPVPAAAVVPPDPYYTPVSRTSPRAASEWVTGDEIRAGFTRMGRPISRTVRIILEKLCLMTR